MRFRYLAAAIVCVALLAGCRGMTSERPPMHPNLNMDFQNRFDPQERNAFFPDQRAMRIPVEGTVARGQLNEDAAYYEGRTPEGEFVETIPRVEVDMQFLQRGQDRFNVFCTPCHGQLGAGNGPIMVGDYNYVPAPTFHQQRLREVNDGYIYDVITNGIRTMPRYGHQIDVRDRWAIVAYVRALQRSQNVPADEMPDDVQLDQ